MCGFAPRSCLNRACSSGDRISGGVGGGCGDDDASLKAVISTSAALFLPVFPIIAHSFRRTRASPEDHIGVPGFRRFPESRVGRYLVQIGVTRALSIWLAHWGARSILSVY